MIITIRTDKPESEVGVYDKGQKIAYQSWHAHRRLAETIHKKLQGILAKNSIDYKNIKGIVVFEGPGSYTGLRIGFSVANSLAYGLSAPVVAAGGDKWIEDGLKKLETAKTGGHVTPIYGGGANTTKQKK